MTLAALRQETFSSLWRYTGINIYPNLMNGFGIVKPDSSAACSVLQNPLYDALLKIKAPADFIQIKINHLP
jgi:hypothetical protein